MLPRNYSDDGNGFGAKSVEQLGLWGDSTSWSITDTRGTEVAGNHDHSFNVTSTSTGSGQAIDKLPTFYALAFIMRVK
jgi:hypothetical protein